MTTKNWKYDPTMRLAGSVRVLNVLCRQTGFGSLTDSMGGVNINGRYSLSEPTLELSEVLM